MPGGAATHSPSEWSNLGHLLRLARIALSRISTPDGLPALEALRQLSICAVLKAHGPASQQWLGDYLRINRSVMVKEIDSLEAESLVTRTRRPKDRRSYALSLTDAGRERVGELGASLSVVGRELTEGLASRQVRDLRSLLAELVAPRYSPQLPGELQDCLCWLVSTARELMEAYGDEVLAPIGLSVRTFISLALLAGHPCSQGRLGSQLSIGAAATVDLVDDLERLGAVKRSRNPADRRSYTVQLTETGSRLEARARQMIAAATAQFTVDMDAYANAQLLVLLTNLVDLRA